MLRFVVDDGHPDGRGYEVRVYRTRALYLRACSRRRPDEVHHTSQATTFNERVLDLVDGRWIERPVIGAIYVHEGLLDAEIVSHEATHAALNLYRRRHRGTVTLGNNQEGVSAARDEEVCHSVGRLTDAIGTRLWDEGIWGPARAKRKAA